jgi:ATP-dependent exoDNAse (exonuclease V) beta subunit
MVSDVKTHRVGQIDLIVWTDRAKKQCYLVDYKSDAEIEKNLQKHFNQMSFYADILKVFGYDVSQVVVWNYTDKWTKYESKVLPIEWK